MEEGQTVECHKNQQWCDKTLLRKLKIKQHGPF